MDASDDGPIAKAFIHQGIEDVGDMLTLTEGDLVNFRYFIVENDAEVEQHLTYGHVRKVVLFIQWYHYLTSSTGVPNMPDEWWNNIPIADFELFRMSNRAVLGAVIPPPAPVPVPVVIPNNVDTQGRSELDSFKRGIKRDGALYPTLRDDKNWDNWNRAMHAQARAHDVNEVLDPDYVPDTATSQALFDQKQSFMYSVLNRCVLTDVGKTFIRQYESTYDAQKVYKCLKEHATKSTAANIAVEKIMEFLTVTKLDSRWKGTTSGFILHWRDKMRMYEDMVSEDEHFTDSVKKRMLEASVRQIPELRQVKTQDEHAQSLGQAALTYIGYFDLLMSAATRRDSELNLPVNRSRRTINAVETNSFGFDAADFFDQGYVDGGESYFNDIDQDSHSGALQVFASEQQQQQHQQKRIPPEIWAKLPKEARDFFMQSRRNPQSFGNSNGQGYQRQAKIHSQESIDVDLYDVPDDFEVNKSNEDSTHDTKVISEVKDTVHGHPGDIRNVLASAHKRTKDSKPKEIIVLNGKTYYAANCTVTMYTVFHRSLNPTVGSLVDRGANGGIAGDDVILIEKTHRKCDVTGIDNHTMADLSIGTCAGLVQSHKGPIIVILHQYAYAGKGNTIHSAAQIEHFGNVVNDKSVRIKNGEQRIITLDGYILPLQFRNGLPYLEMSKPAQNDMDEHPHVVLTSDQDWDPHCLDNEIDSDNWHDAWQNVPKEMIYPADVFDEEGTFRDTNVSIEAMVTTVDIQRSTTFHDLVDNIIDLYVINNRVIDVKEPPVKSLRPNFAWAPMDVIKKTFESTTQWARMTERYPFRKHFKARFPALNVSRRNETVSTDTVFSDTPAIGNGCKIAQVFVGHKSLVTDVYPMKFESDFPRTLQDNIRKRGAMDKLASDSARVEISSKVNDILRHYIIDDWQSEPYHEHQNPAERRYQVVKRYTNIILDRTGAPPETWLLCMQYVCSVLNLLANDSIGNVPPLQVLTGQTQDISILLTFHFWEPVYYATADALSYNTSVSFPLETA